MLWLALLVAQTPFDSILTDPLLDGAIVSAYAVDGTGQVLLDHNSQLRMMPASNQKIVSCAYALQALGPSYRPATRIWKLKDRTVIDSPGDPTMTFNQLKAAAAGFDRRKPLFLRQAYGPLLNETWAYGDLPNRYSAQVSAFGFDQAAFAMWAVNGKPVLLPGAFGVKTTFLPSAQPARVVYDPIRRLATVSGAMPKATTKLDTLALPRPDLDAGSLFSNLVRRTSKVPNSAATKVLLGKPIAETIADCLKPSDNIIAENLLMMAATSEGAKPTYAGAQASLEAFLAKEVQAPKGAFSPEDGSGLSRRNIATSRGLVEVLEWAKRQPTASLFRNALAKPGEKGTLRTRLAGVRFEGKTGSLFMVSALSGYLTSPGGKEGTVSILLNHFSCSADEARGVMDRLVKAIAAKLDETGLLRD